MLPTPSSGGTDTELASNKPIRRSEALLSSSNRGGGIFGSVRARLSRAPHSAREPLGMVMTMSRPPHPPPPPTKTLYRSTAGFMPTSTVIGLK